MAHVKITISGISNHVNYCVIIIACRYFANMAVGHVTQPGGQWVELPCGVTVYSESILFWDR